jgi:hypothetical protein
MHTRGRPPARPLCTWMGCSRHCATSAHLRAWQRELRGDRCRSCGSDRPERGGFSVLRAQLFQKVEPMPEVHPIPRERKLFERAFTRPILNWKGCGLCAFHGPRRRKEAREDEELYPFLRRLRSRKELIDLRPIGLSLNRFDVAPADLQSYAADEGIVQRLEIQPGLRWEERRPRTPTALRELPSSQPEPASRRANQGQSERQTSRLLNAGGSRRIRPQWMAHSTARSKVQSWSAGATGLCNTL